MCQWWRSKCRQLSQINIAGKLHNLFRLPGKTQTNASDPGTLPLIFHVCPLQAVMMCNFTLGRGCRSFWMVLLPWHSWWVSFRIGPCHLTDSMTHSILTIAKHLHYFKDAGQDMSKWNQHFHEVNSSSCQQHAGCPTGHWFEPLLSRVQLPDAFLDAIQICSELQWNAPTHDPPYAATTLRSPEVCQPSPTSW